MALVSSSPPFFWLIVGFFFFAIVYFICFFEFSIFVVAAEFGWRHHILFAHFVLLNISHLSSSKSLFTMGGPK